jgi:hypothetical protein
MKSRFQPGVRSQSGAPATVRSLLPGAALGFDATLGVATGIYRDGELEEPRDEWNR